MMFNNYFVLSVVCLSLSQIASGFILRDDSTNETVKLSLYYESLCPDSIEFISKHLYPGYKQLGDALIVDLVPYGNAVREQVEGSWQFTCQHGPNECVGNKIQACVVAQETLTQSQKMGFVGCIMSSDDPSSYVNAQSCAVDNGLDWDGINSCATGPDGVDLLVHYGEVTDALNPPLEYVPHILFNDKFDEELETRSRYYFMSAVCSLFKVKPSGCVC